MCVEAWRSTDKVSLSEVVFIKPQPVIDVDASRVVLRGNCFLCASFHLNKQTFRQYFRLQETQFTNCIDCRLGSGCLSMVSGLGKHRLCVLAYVRKQSTFISLDTHKIILFQCMTKIYKYAIYILLTYVGQLYVDVSFYKQCIHLVFLI